MNKIISRIISAALSTSIIFGTAASVYAETISVEPNYPIHGNKCGALYIDPELDRDVYVKITQFTEDGDYVYYDTKISSPGEDNSGAVDYSFILEGKDDVSYTVSIGVPKYKLSKNQGIFTYEFTISDTDNIVDETVNGYSYIFEVVGSEDLNAPAVVATSLLTKTDDNVYEKSLSVAFPTSDYLPGDANFDDRIDLYDAIEIAKYLIDKSYFGSEQLKAADINEDNKVDLYDAIEIAKILVNK